MALLLLFQLLDQCYLDNISLNRSIKLVEKTKQAKMQPYLTIEKHHTFTVKPNLYPHLFYF